MELDYDDVSKSGSNVLDGRISITKENWELFPIKVESVKFGNMKLTLPFLFVWVRMCACVHVCMDVCRCVACSWCANVYAQRPRLLGVFLLALVLYPLDSPSQCNPELTSTALHSRLLWGSQYLKLALRAVSTSTSPLHGFWAPSSHILDLFLPDKHFDLWHLPIPIADYFDSKDWLQFLRKTLQIIIYRLKIFVPPQVSQKKLPKTKQKVVEKFGLYQCSLSCLLETAPPGKLHLSVAVELLDMCNERKQWEF